MHLTDLITPEELVSEMGKVVSNDDIEARNFGRVEVLPFMQALLPLFGESDDKDGFAMTMSVLQVIEGILQRKKVN